MNKKYIIIRYPKDEQCSRVPENNVVFHNFNNAVTCINGMLRQEDRHPIPERIKEQALTISLNDEIVELWIAGTRPMTEINSID